MRFDGKCVAQLVCLLVLSLAGCSGPPNKADVEKKVQAQLTAASPDWKEIKYNTTADNLVSVVAASRVVDGKPCEFSFTGGKGSGGVAIRSGGEWLCKYRYEKDKEVNAEKMKGADSDVETYRKVAAEYAAACIKACP